MKKYGRLLLITSILLLGTLFITGCRAVLVPADEEIESGELDTRQYDYDEFTRIDISSSFSYEIRKADSWSVEITAGSNLFEYISVTVSGQELDVDMNTPGVSIWKGGSYTTPKVIITMPELAALDSSGATDGTVIGFSSDHDLDISLSGASEVELSDMTAGQAFLDLSGASKVTGSIQVDNIEIDVSSASQLHLDGLAGDVILDARGASRADLADFIANNVDAILRDASSGTVNLDGKLNARLSGASTLEYIGEPVIGELDVTGASTFRKK
jgi:hypothetical protein